MQDREKTARELQTKIAALQAQCEQSSIDAIAMQIEQLIEILEQEEPEVLLPIRPKPQ